MYQDIQKYFHDVSHQIKYCRLDCVYIEYRAWSIVENILWFSPVRNAHHLHHILRVPKPDDNYQLSTLDMNGNCQ